jgi:hypothetical protein
MGLGPGLGTEARGKILCLCRGSKPGVQSVVRHCTHCTPATALPLTEQIDQYICGLVCLLLIALSTVC